MNLESKNYLSGVCVIANHCNPLLFVELPLSQDIKDLMTTVKDKLKICKRILLDYKQDIKFYFSEDDLRVLQMLDLLKSSNGDFNNNLQDNIVIYSLENIKLIDILIDSKELELKDRDKYKTLTKWYDLNPLLAGDSKLKTILKNQLYAGFPNGFNDIFDSRVNCYEGIIHKLAIKYIHDKFIMNSNKLFSLEMRKVFIRYYQAFFNAANADCFSLCNPVNFESHNMWGLYCRSEYGIALEYDLKEYLEVLEKSIPDISAIIYKAIGQVSYSNELAIKLQGSLTDSSLNTRILKMNYKEKFNPFELFEKYIKLLSEKLDASLINSDVDRVLRDFYRSKNEQWKFEKEVRFLNFDYLYRSSLDVHHPLNMKYFINNYNKALSDIPEYEKNFLKNPVNRIKFIKPSKIVLKWNCNENSEIIKRLLLYAKQLAIPVVKISSIIDYGKDEFRFDKLKI